MSADVERLLARLRFRHLQLLVAVDQTGSLRAGAQRLHLTQPALSKALRELESMLGYPLFEREASGLKRTARGAVLIEGAHLLIAELSHVRDEADAAGPDGQAAAILRVGMPRFLAVTVLAQVVQRLWSGATPIRLHVSEANSPQLFEGLRSGVLDAVLTVFSSDAVALGSDQTLHYERFAFDDYAVIAERAHPLAQRQAIGWDRLAHEKWILPCEPSLTRVLLEQAFLGSGAMPPVPAIESDSPVTNVRLVSRGLGLAIVPGVVMREAQAAGAVARLNVAPPLPRTSVGMACRASALTHRRIRALREALNTLREPGSTALLLR